MRHASIENNRVIRRIIEEDHAMPSNNNPGCLFALLNLFKPKEDDKGPLQYRLRDDFLSKAERLFHGALVAAVNGRAAIVFKVNLGDLFFVSQPHQNRGAMARIDRKHVDFLLCDPGTLKPLCGIELDDSSHDRPSRQARDEFVDQVFQTAGLPLIHVPCRSFYDPAELDALLRKALSPEATPPTPSPAQPAAQTPATPQTATPPPTATPVCPKCSVPMVLRESARGPFYGCPNYPKCRQTASKT
jgi:hypothetical protein